MSMPHTARVISKSGYYHVIPNGIADQLIFACDEDRVHYIELLRRAKKEFGFALHAYCLMSNHTHLLVEASFEQLSHAMKFVHERYAMRYASEIGRTGGVFRKPYWSEPIESNEHLLCAVRYVHANPAAAGLCAASAYDWSSAKDYLGRGGITDTAMVLDMCGGKEGFIKWSRQENLTAIPFPGSRLKRHLTDEKAFAIAKMILTVDPTNLRKLDTDTRLPALKTLKERGLSVRQISRITGLGKNEITRA